MLDISLLGPTEVRVSGVSVSLSPLERNLLAVLALSKGMVISTERIIDCLWGDRLPASPRSRVQGLVSSLRRKVGDALVTRHPGYVIESSETRVDLDECEDLARAARQASSPSEVSRCLRQALDLWRGEPLDGVAAPGIEFDRVRLTELRVGLLEDRFAADLELGCHAEVVAELAAMVSAYPLRERLAGQLMLALYRGNRQADALTVFNALRERLAEELGSDPCADVRNLHATILRGEPISDRPTPPIQRTLSSSSTASSSPSWPSSAEMNELRPAQLPASVGHFTGRDAELAALTRAINRPSDEPRVIAVSGAGGIGKTALLVRWAHSVADRFPDGQLFLDLHGRDPRETLSPASVLGPALRALGVSKDDLPASADERASLYRTLISNRRVLIVADDAGELDQLLVLVPPTPTSQLVTSSRQRLLALAGYHAVQPFGIEPLSPAATRDLLARVVGARRLIEPAATAMVAWCGGWPLVTRFAATKLSARPWQSLESFVAELGDVADQLLDDDPRSVRSALVSAYQALSPAAAYLFSRLGLSSSGSISLQRPTATAQPSVQRIRRLLDELVAVHLIVEVGPDRYRVHDVVRRFARQCGAELLDRDAVDQWVHNGSYGVAEPAGHMADPHRI
jgi:DNA-binding SARP family transcriptional activator